MGCAKRLVTSAIKTTMSFALIIVLRQGDASDVPANTYDPNKIISVATLEGYAPFCFRQSVAETNEIGELIPPGHDSKRLQGFSWDVVRLSLHQKGYTIKLMVYPWARVLSLARRNEVDVVFPAAKTEMRSQFLVFSKYPVNTVHYVIYVNKKKLNNWRGLEDIIGVRLAGMRGWDYGRYWNAHLELIELREVNTVEQGFQMLDHNRVEGVAGYEEVFDHYLIEKGMDEKFGKLPAFDQGFEFLSGNKLNPNIKLILNDFDSSRQRLIKQGILVKLKKHWFPLSNPDI